MSQTRILANLKLYLSHTIDDYLIELSNEEALKIKAKPKDAVQIAALYEKKKQALLKHIEDIQMDLGSGYCLGFSITHGAMDVVGKLNWWEALLVDLAMWDGRKESLNQQLNLPDAEENKSKSEKLTTRGYLYQRALNYILFNYGSRKKSYHSFMPEGITQDNILTAVATPNESISSLTKDPNSSDANLNRFLLIDNKNNIRTIQSGRKFAGHMTEDMLENLLEERLVEGAICIIDCGDHAIRVAYRNNNWCIYDPNYKHNTTPIYRSGTKSEIVKEAFHRLERHDICVEIANIDEAKIAASPYYDYLMRNVNPNILQENGFHMMANYNPKELAIFFRNANESEYKDEIYSLIGKALSKQDLNNYSGLHMLAAYAPEALRELLLLIAKSDPDSTLKKDLSDALFNRSTKHSRGLHSICSSVPDLLPLIFDLGDNSSAGQEIHFSINDALVEKETLNGYTGIHLLAKNRIELVPATINFLLSNKSNDNNIIWLEYLLDALTNTNDNAVSAWEVINRDKTCSKAVVKIIKNHLKQCTTETLLTLEKNLTNALTDEHSKYRGFCRLKPSFLNHFGSPYGKTDFWKELMGETRFILADRKNSNSLTKA